MKQNRFNLIAIINKSDLNIKQLPNRNISNNLPHLTAKMPSGSCLCGNVAYEYSGNPVTTAICHCTNCQKWTGSKHSANLAIATEAFSVTTGTPATFTLKGSSGKDHVHAFCNNCGTSLYSQPEALGSVTLIKTGTLDDVAIRDLQVANELFVKDRLNFGRALEGAVQYVENLGGSTA